MTRPPSPHPPRKPFTRRLIESSASLRPRWQLVFLVLNVLIGAQFYVWVRYYETGGTTLRVARPPGVEGWLPIAALMNLKLLIDTGQVPHFHAAGMFLLVAFLSMSWLFKKSFCSWLCPIGTISEWLWQGGQALFGTTVRVPRWLDVPLRSLKYVLLGLFLFAVGSMSAEAIAAFLTGPYGRVADVKMLNFFREMSRTTALVIGLLLLISVPIKNAWCRYLCPYGALLGLAGLLSPARIIRNPDACIDCAKCAQACPSSLPVDRLASIRSAECTSCLTCVTACPAAGALDLAWMGRRRPVRAWVVAATVAAIFLAVTVGARVSGRWHTIIPDQELFGLVPQASQFSHP
ncbi:MAG: 4Fe-4S binding protein [Vicinamibacterales bacterium]